MTKARIVSVYLSEEQYNFLKMTADARGTSMSLVLRDLAFKDVNVNDVSRKRGAQPGNQNRHKGYIKKFFPEYAYREK